MAGIFDGVTEIQAIHDGPDQIIKVYDGATLIEDFSSSTFTPASLSDLLFWHDGALSSKSYHSGSLVSQWDDLSGNDRHWTQSTSGLAPSDGVRTINSIPALDFDGSDDLLTMGTGHGISTIAHIFLVAIQDTHVGVSDALLNAGAATDPNDGFLLRQSATANRLQALLSNAVGSRDILDSGAGNTYTPGSVHLIEFRFSGTGTYGIAIDGVETTATASNGGCSGPDEFTLMHGVDGATSFIVGYSSIKSGDDLTDLRNYINTRFGL